MSYPILVADPPWRFKDKLTMKSTKRGAGSHYSTLTIQQIKDFPMPEPVGKNALLFLWRVSSMQEQALDVMRAWGFTPKSELVWVKTSKGKTIVENAMPKLSFGMGRYTRMAHEVCLIGRRGSIAVHSHSVRSVFFAPAGAHSAKPDAFYDIVEKLHGGPYLELFARRQRQGWSCHGNELTGAGE